VGVLFRVYLKEKGGTPLSQRGKIEFGEMGTKGPLGEYLLFYVVFVPGGLY
jgi:hypothetical protein